VTGWWAMGHPRLDLNGVTILVVDDDGAFQDLMRRFITSFGAGVREARNGEEALSVLRKEKPQLIFCDLRMPVMDGFGFMERVASDPLFCRIPIIAVSGVGTEGQFMRTWAAGFSGHLLKPIGREVIAAQLERVFWAHPRTEAVGAGA
jgi:CheY-like chemotaxis protein